MLLPSSGCLGGKNLWEYAILGSVDGERWRAMERAGGGGNWEWKWNAVEAQVKTEEIGRAHV